MFFSELVTDSPVILMGIKDVKCFHQLLTLINIDEKAHE